MKFNNDAILSFSASLSSTPRALFPCLLYQIINLLPQFAGSTCLFIYILIFLVIICCTNRWHQVRKHSDEVLGDRTWITDRRIPEGQMRHFVVEDTVS